MKTRAITLLLQISSGEMPALVTPSLMGELTQADLITSERKDEVSRWFTTEKGETLVDSIKALVNTTV